MVMWKVTVYIADGVRLMMLLEIILLMENRSESSPLCLCGDVL